MQRAPPANDLSRIPAPSSEAALHSAQVLAHIRRSIEAAGGWIPLADYVNEALYAPGLGYYVAGARKFGADGDFVTAPELTSLFGKAVAAQVEEVLAQVPGDVVELGPGSGKMAADVLEALVARDALPQRYLLLEVSPELRERQRQTLVQRSPQLLGRVAWIDALPHRWSGVLLANEVLDAIPAHVVARAGGRWVERGVTVDGAVLRLADRPLRDDALLEAARAAFPPDGDYLSEVNPAAQALVRSLARRCERGAMLFVDYGFPAAEFYHPQRSQGTLMAHYRHRALADPLIFPGLADLTTHVDFSAIAGGAVAEAMDVAGFATQARFLVNCGVLDLLAAIGEPTTAPYLREAKAVQTLLSPAEMGELVKVLALTRDIAPPLRGFRAGDRSHRL
ncbi:MAG: SAM-dependent methyltransferase [Betaproteobacteria bacterium]